MADFNTWNNYGGLHVEDNVTAEAGGSSATPAKILAWAVVMPSSSTCTPSISTDDITITDAGDYLVTAQCSFSGSNDDTYDIEIYKDAVATNLKCRRVINSAGDIGSASITGIITLTAGQAISLYQSTSTGGTAFTLRDAQLTVTKLGWQ